MPLRLNRACCLLLLGLLTASAGCKVTETDIDTWRGTRKGPGKMVAVVQADKYSLDLRTYAALALITMERQDVDGVVEMQHAMQKVEPETRTQLVEGLANRLIELIQKPADPPTADGSPSPSQVRAKDAAFLLADSAAPATREKLTQAVVSWYAADFNGRSLAGNFSAEQVVRGLGSSAAAKLVDTLNAQLPQAALIKLSELIGQLGDPPTRHKAAVRLVQIEQEMESQSFIDWLSAEVTRQMKQAGQTPDPARVAKAVDVNRDNFITNGAVPAMRLLADQPEVSARLLEIAALKDPKLTERRTHALQALEGKLGPDQLDEVLALALDNTNPASVRDYAFDRVGDTRNPRALSSLWPLLRNEDQRLRWRAGELILAIGGPAVLGEFFNKLPADSTYEPEELEGYAQRMAQMTPAPRKYAVDHLQGPSWWDKVIALNYIQRKGTEADLALIQPLIKSSEAVHGKRWEKSDTVGTVAERTSAGLRERLKEATANAAAR